MTAVENGSSTGEQKTEASLLVTNDDDTPKSRCCPIEYPLLFIKGFYFFFMGGVGCVLPFLSVYYKQLGLSPQQIGLISGLRPIIGFTSGPVWGSLADRFSIHRILLYISLLSWIGVFVGLAFVPPAEKIESCPAVLKPYRPVIKLPSPRTFDYYNSHIISDQNHTHDARRIDYHDIFSHLKTNTSHNLTKHEDAILRENIGWIYDPSDLQRVFITVLTLILLGEFFQSPTTALSDTGTLRTLGPGRLNDYGHQRAWGPLGWAVTSVSVGALVAVTRFATVVCGVTLYFSDYFSFVYVFIGFMFCAFLCATQIRFKEPDSAPDSSPASASDSAPKSPDANQDYSTMAVLKVFVNVHYGSWLLTAFFVGVFNGVIWGFLSWHLDNLGADQLLIGTTNVVNALAEFAMFFFVHHVIRLIGHMGIMYLGLLGYALRFAGYAFIVNPWLVVPFEVLQGVTFSCVWVSLTTYSTLTVPSSSLATIQGILHGVYFGLGNGSGHLLGGLLIGEFGAVITFSSLAVLSVLVAIALFIAQQCSTKPDFAYESFQNQADDLPSKTPEKQPSDPYSNTDAVPLSELPPKSMP